MKKIAVYNGSFDPVTNGHLDIIERAAKIFDILYVTVAIHPTKVGLFTIEQRKELLKKATAHLKNVIVDSTDELLDYVKKSMDKCLSVAYVQQQISIMNYNMHNLINI